MTDASAFKARAWSLKQSWGFSILSLASALALVRLLRQDVPGHYRVFTGAARALWSGQLAYGTDFGTHVGYFFYSPTCALFFFGPFAFLPEKIGITLYMMLSWAVFVWGAKKFFETFAQKSSLNLASGSDAGLLQWFWIAVLPQVFGAILASKLELMIAGLLLASMSWLASGTLLYLASAILALTLNWKFQPLPMAGLAMISWIHRRKDWKIPASLAASLGFFYLLPYAFLPREFLLQNHEVWSETFSKFVAESVLNFENLFAFLNHALGVPMSFAATQLISAGVGAGLAVFLLAWLSRGALLHEGILLSTALGAMFMTAFSPLGQNNAMVLYAPLLLSGVICLAHASSSDRRRWIITLGLTFAVMTLSYSDLVPLAFRDQLRFWSIKPLACLGLGLAIASEAWRRRGFFSSR